MHYVMGERRYSSTNSQLRHYMWVSHHLLKLQSFCPSVLRTLEDKYICFSLVLWMLDIITGIKILLDTYAVINNLII
jgi:hypothetical protein